MPAPTPVKSARPWLPLPPGPLRGAFTFLLFVLNTAFWVVPLILLALVKSVVRTLAARRLLGRALTAIAEGWIGVNRRILALTQAIAWQVSGVEGLDPGAWYLVVANHRSWVDIVAVQVVLNRRIPFLKFFIKDQLRWVPVLGLAWWALDMPFMKRYTRAQLERRPELRGTDLATTRRACDRFRLLPTSVINFVEGTRFTAAKRAAGGAPYRHLLAPRAGGIAFVLGAMGPTFTALLDLTIAYPAGDGGFWAMCCGRVRAITIEVERRPVPDWVARGDYANDPEFRSRFQAWLAALWARKDARLAELLAAGG
jgi:1-acyl-sn-glycerol-3-phosphate acyltransferase